MMTDTELRIKGFDILIKTMGSVEADRFISLVNKEPFDYTQWQKNLWNDISVEQLSRLAMQNINNSGK